MQLRFSKYEGLGNDFVVVGGDCEGWLTPEVARALCDRHFGIGADGVLFAAVRDGQPVMKVINADGSVPEMCGNGLRCVALYLVHEGLVSGTDWSVQTDAGLHACSVRKDAAEPGQAEVSVMMVPASLRAADVFADHEGQAVDEPFEVDGTTLHVTAVSMGNPHAVFFDDVGRNADALGPRIERDKRFRAGANVGFAQLRGDHAVQLRVWERGVGWTLACGTGACAAAVAAVVSGRASGEKPVSVRLPGGELSIEVQDGGKQLRMTGPARRVFEGTAEVSV